MTSKQILNRNYELKHLQWDTDYFGISSARVNLRGIIDDKGQEEIIEFCKGYEFVTIANIGNIKENNYWIGNRTNAFLTDINMQFLKILDDKSYEQDEKTYVMNSLSPNEQIVNLAKKTFKQSRFFNDPKLPQSEAENIYTYWTECAFGQKDKYFVISERAGNIAGYSLFSFDEDCGLSELTAIDEKYQGQRVGTALLEKVEEFLVTKKQIYKIKTGTQIDNIGSTKMLTKLKYERRECISVYHLWRMEEKI